MPFHHMLLPATIGKCQFHGSIGLYSFQRNSSLTVKLFDQAISNLQYINVLYYIILHYIISIVLLYDLRVFVLYSRHFPFSRQTGRIGFWSIDYRLCMLSL